MPRRRAMVVGDRATRLRIAHSGIVLSIAALLCSGCGSASSPPPAPRPGATATVVDQATMRELDRGVGLMGQFEFTQAQELFAQLLQAHPALLDAQLNHAISILNQTSEGAQERAIVLLAEILQAHPQETRAEYCQGLAFLFLGDPRNALPRFLKAVERFPSDSYAQFYAGQCSELLNDLPAARSFYERAAQLDPELRSAYLGLQRVSARLGDEPAAAAALAMFQRLMNNPRSRLAEFKYTRMGPLGEAVLPTGPVVIAAATGAPFAAATPMTVGALPVGATRLLHRASVADIDGDGRMDLFLPNPPPMSDPSRPSEQSPASAPLRTSNSIVLAQAGGGWRLAPEHPLGAVPCVGALWADLNNDGLMDVVLNRAQPEATFEIRLQQPDGQWTALPVPAITAPGAHHATALLLADVDHDGDVDIVASIEGAATLLLNRLDGTFEARILETGADVGITQALASEGALHAAAPALRTVDACVCADMDGDGDLDLIFLRGAIGAWATPQVWINDGLWAWHHDAKDPRWSAFESHLVQQCVPFIRAEDGTPMLATLCRAAAPAEAASRGAAGPTELIVWEAGAAGLTLRTRRGVGSMRWMAVADLRGAGTPCILLADDPSSEGSRDAPATLEICDQAGATIERIIPPGARAAPTTPADFIPVIFDAQGVELLGSATTALDALQRWGSGPGRMPMAALDLRGRIDPSQQMRTNASGLGTAWTARVGGGWVAGRRTPWCAVAGVVPGAPAQSLEPVLVGLGTQRRADFLALDWPDGVVQTELDIAAAADHGIQRITETQRQISSCPVIFAWNGARHAFVTDCLGVGGLGYLSGIQQDAKGVLTPMYAPPRPWERVMLGDATALAPRAGCFEVLLGEPMEEACYLDAARLVAYDIPAEWQIALDERMGVNGPEPTGAACFYRHAMTPSRATAHCGVDDARRLDAVELTRAADFTRAADATGEDDLTSALAARDDVAADPGPVDHRFIGRVAAERVITLEFPQSLEARVGNPALLIDGWVEYPYSTTTFAMWQARAAYQAPTLEALDPATGAWITLVAEYGYPAGMPRQAMFPIDRQRVPAGCTTLRLRTTMELYLDRVQLAWLEACPQARRIEVPLAEATLLDAGFPRRIDHAQRRPEYDASRRLPLWDCRKQPGLYTALGACTPLLAATDDAVAIFGAGEELRLRFDATAIADCPTQTRRAWVLEVDGWCKDMDPCTGDGARLSPLPLRQGSASTPEREALHAHFNTRYQGGR